MNTILMKLPKFLAVSPSGFVPTVALIARR